MGWIKVLGKAVKKRLDEERAYQIKAEQRSRKKKRR